MTGLWMRLNPIWMQLSAHLLFIVLSFWIHVQQRPIWLIFALWIFVLVIEKAFQRLEHRQHWVWPLASLGVANSIYLNMEAYGIGYWPFFLAVGAALAAKHFLREPGGRPIFNPSLVGVFLIATVFPWNGSAAMYGWNNDGLWVALVLITGIFTTARAGTLPLCVSYLGSFMIFSVLFLLVMRLFPETRSLFVPDRVPVLLYPLSIFSFGNILFAFHGIGDPSTGPRSLRGKVLFGLAMGPLDFLLRLGVVIVAPFLAYVILLLVMAGIRTWRAGNGQAIDALPSRG